jgi:hypothetical protein
MGVAEVYRFLLLAAVMLGLFATAYVAVSSLLLCLLPRKPVLPLQRIRLMLEKRRRYRLLRALLLVPKEESRLDELRILLEACGWPIDAADYTAVKRLLIIGLTFIGAIAYRGWEQQWIAGMALIAVAAACVAALVVLGCDRLIWRAMREQRRARIVREIQLISSQLLYYKHSRMNLHHQLQRCVPLTSYIRRELQLLVNEWYEGAGEAIRRFRKRLATEEAYDFAETLNALRLHGSETYYELLQERIRSYKEKLALIRDGRKEATSYLLFVMSGVPIFYTFLIFIYPWVAESRVLFQSLG